MPKLVIRHNSIFRLYILNLLLFGFSELLSYFVFVKGSCPKPGENLICPIGLRNTCVDDLSCGPPGTVCCFDGCRKRCMDSSHFRSGGINREGEKYTATLFHVKCYRELIRYLKANN